MSMQHVPLEASKLSPDVQRALGAGPAKLMAARGLAPIRNPGDLITLLYQLSLDADPNIRTAANKTAGELPPTILRAALASPVDSRVLDFFGQKVVHAYELIETVILNQGTADETISWIAERGGAPEIDLIATNQQRMLRHPAIIGAMYLNRRAPMSTVDKAVELAVHNRIRVPGIAAWDEICAAILTSGKRAVTAEDDAEFAAAALRGDGELREVTEEELLAEAKKRDQKRWSERTLPEKIRLVTLGTVFHRAEGIRDPNKLVAMATVKAPGVKESEAQKWASSTSLLGDVIAYIADKREWTKQYNIKLALVQNPKCPLPSATRLVPHIRERELKAIARSKSVSSAVSAQCKKILMQRTSAGRGTSK